jgi:hypothetical protein
MPSRGGCFDKRQEPDVPVDFAVDDDPAVVEETIAD